MKTDTKQQNKKKAYQAPKLISYGKLEDLTQTATGPGSDGAALGSGP